MEQDQEKMALVVLLATSGSVAGNSLKISFVSYITKQTKINQFKNIRKAYFCVISGFYEKKKWSCLFSTFFLGGGGGSEKDIFPISSAKIVFLCGFPNLTLYL